MQSAISVVWGWHSIASVLTASRDLNPAAPTFPNSLWHAAKNARFVTVTKTLNLISREQRIGKLRPRRVVLKLQMSQRHHSVEVLNVRDDLAARAPLVHLR